MYLRHLELVNFKNHSNLVFDFDTKFNILIGKNGVGKTNILDAIYYLANFKSHIVSLDNQNILHDAPFFRLRGLFDEQHEVVVKFAPRSKSIEINQVKVQKYSEAFGHVPLVLASPADIFLLHDGSEERRKFIDYTIASYHKEYLHNLNHYQHIIDQRNAYLKNTENPDLELIKYYNRELSTFGHKIYEVRKLALSELEQDVLRWYHTIAQNLENINVSYTSQLHEYSLSYLLEHSWAKDMALKRTTAGIHRDDLRMSMSGEDVKKIASQGQQKSLLYALRLAQAEFLARKRGIKPLFLIDDFSDKLDVDRQSRLLDIMTQIDFIEQWFVTDTGKMTDNLKINANIIHLGL